MFTLRSWKSCPSALLFLSFFSIMLGLSIESAPAQTQTPIFPITLQQSLTPDMSGNPVIGDFNGDGTPDLAYVNSISGGSSLQYSLNVLLGVGSSSPTVMTTPTCGTLSTAADVNNDKILDVVLTCNGYITVLLGKGDGSFQAPSYYAVNTIGSPVLTDLNGDGYLDIVVGTLAGNSTTASQITVLLNQGVSAPGNYGNPQSYPASSTTLGLGVLASGDFNGDGKQDVVMPYNGGFFLFYGNGDGTFPAAQTQSIPAGSVAFLTTGDFNRDGMTDIAYTSGIALSGELRSWSVQILLGNSSGTLSQGTALQLSPTATASSIFASALTSDGNLDLIVANNATTIFRGDGKGGFVEVGSYAPAGYSLIADLNSDGKQDLLLVGSFQGFYTLLGNGDGSFQGIPVTQISNPASSFSADVNGDGISDVVFVPQQTDSSVPPITTALGRGDGTFAVLNQSAALPAVAFLVMGDFNQDGKVDTVAVQPGNGACFIPHTAVDAQIFSYLGSGSGTFQKTDFTLDLNVIGAETAVSGDFNGDGKPDLVVAYQDPCVHLTGLLFVPGNGDGTFGSPVSFSQHSPDAGNLLVGDLNNDKKLDFIAVSAGAVYLGNGDGTFKQIPLNLPTDSGHSLALGDINGDGYPDLIASLTGTYTVGIFAGNGDGTFQTAAPLYSPPLPEFTSVFSAAIGDVNADGHPDLLVFYSPTTEDARVSVSLGDGKGNFIADTNSYFAGTLPSIPLSVFSLNRLNNQAPVQPTDGTLDIFVSTSGGLTSLLNQRNPVPTKPMPIVSSTTLLASATSGNVNAQITLTATVSGISPTGSVAFASGDTVLGTATLNNGIATLQTSFANAGSYSVTANYSGDSNNAPSSSSAVTISVIAPDFTVSASPASATITAGQSATFTFTVTPVGGYSGTVKFSCGSLPSEVTCSFSPASVTPSSGSAVTSTLTIATTAATAKLGPGPDNQLPMKAPWIPAGTLAVAGILGIVLTPRSAKRLTHYLRVGSFMVLFMAGWITFQGCGGTANSSPQKNPGTPQGASTISVTVADSGSGPQHPVTVNLTVQ